MTATHGSIANPGIQIDFLYTTSGFGGGDTYLRCYIDGMAGTVGSLDLTVPVTYAASGSSSVPTKVRGDREWSNWYTAWDDDTYNYIVGQRTNDTVHYDYVTLGATGRAYLIFDFWLGAATPNLDLRSQWTGTFTPLPVNPVDPTPTGPIEYYPAPSVGDFAIMSSEPYVDHLRLVAPDGFGSYGLFPIPKGIDVSWEQPPPPEPPDPGPDPLLLRPEKITGARYFSPL